MAQTASRLIAIAAFSACAALSGDNFDLPPPRYGRVQVAREFRTEQSAGAIRAITADRDSYIWLATDRALLRFDGAHFHTVLKEGFGEVVSTSDGSVWAGGRNGLVAIRHGEIRRVASEPVMALAARGGEVVVSGTDLRRGTVDGLSRVDVRANGALSVDREQRVWFGCGEDLCALGLDGAVVRVGREARLPPMRWMSGVRTRNREYFLVASTGVYLSQNGVTRRIGSEPGVDPVRLFQSRSGRWWMSGASWFDGTSIVNARPALPSAFDPSITEDPSGNLWWSGGGSSLCLISPTVWVDGWTDLRSRPVQIRRTRDGALIAATTSGLVRFDAAAGAWRPLASDFTGHPVRSFIDAAGGGLWLLMQDGAIVRVDSQGRRTAEVFRGSDKGIQFRNLVKDRQGRVWVCAKKTLFRNDESIPRLVETPIPDGGANPVAFAAGPDAQEWLGYEGGIARLDNETWRLELPASQLLSYRVRNIAVGPGPVFWVSYRLSLPSSYLWREGGQWKRRDFRAEDGYPPFETYGLLRDRRGWIWRGSGDGLFVSDGVHEDAGRWAMFDEVHGLPSRSIELSGMFEDNDGSIWAASADGIAHIHPDPAWFEEAADDAPARVTAVRWQGRENLWPADGIQLPADAHGVEIDLARPPKAVPRPDLLHVRLRPRDTGWTVATKPTVHIETLPPGEYKLETAGASSDVPLGSFSFRVPPANPISPWSFALLGTALAGGAAFFTRRHWLPPPAPSAYWNAKTSSLPPTARIPNRRTSQAKP